jgi:hypothetical protein
MSEDLPPIFISHSGRDRDMLAGVLEAFDYYNRGAGKKRPYIVMSSEQLSRCQEPNWLQVKKEIQRSDALILVLSKGVTNREYTQNWIAFEVGIAAGCNPPKPVIAIQAARVRIPIPYVTHYYSYSNTLPPSNMKDKSRWAGTFNLILAEPLADVNFKPEHPQVRCPACRSEYHYHGPERLIQCPCCPCIIQNKPAVAAVH